MPVSFAKTLSPGVRTLTVGKELEPFSELAECRGGRFLGGDEVFDGEAISQITSQGDGPRMTESEYPQASKL